ncbi:cytochrome b/b6 domain-containing protein [Shewanella sp. D64]|uniref:cytochrome b/b6 domain-containing protein n=1 Tax=unclassified Shewanella TaxID=196818 RepID=UPI0022BA2BA0|nr:MULTISPECIES: cytochrome b/b6 domain-containing protein [unclassified Shewanella]MEC4724189.1 cytochrome b/b6 domain-containing protein [Shewanella sp. D64]MEC4736209.1 cytochrome b/b6 domain-containing protein [Shewanella sp. E94]WBJ97857.1 cytochrome b/b6 domain-containing protein [Shewanella sp. MTB7]
MKLANEQTEETKSYQVWDRPSRLFHWVNVLLVISLLFVGFLMLFRTDLGIDSLVAKIKIKELHVIIGYLFAANLLFRIQWGFIGSHFARFANNIPSLRAMKKYKSALDRGDNPQYIGHNPMGKLAVFIIMLTLTVMLVTGLFRAGTDIYYPPFGGAITEYIAQDGVDAASIKPYNDTGVDKQKLAEIKPYKSLAGKIHLYGAYFLMLLIFLHVIAVIQSERKHQPGIISAMFSGIKRISGPTQDKE